MGSEDDLMAYALCIFIRFGLRRVPSLYIFNVIRNARTAKFQKIKQYYNYLIVDPSPNLALISSVVSAAVQTTGSSCEKAASHQQSHSVLQLKF